MGASEPSKGESTRRRVIERAMVLAGQLGLEGVTIGELAADLGLSKSGLFAHFKSKERLQLAVLETAAEDFANHVFVAAFRTPRGEQRLNAIFENWLNWIVAPQLPGGCVFLAGAMEWDDRDGPVREALVVFFKQLYTALHKAIALAIQTNEFDSQLDVEQFASEMHGIVLKFHLDNRLLGNRDALDRARKAFARLVDNARP